MFELITALLPHAVNHSVFEYSHTDTHTHNHARTRRNSCACNKASLDKCGCICLLGIATNPAWARVMFQGEGAARGPVHMDRALTKRACVCAGLSAISCHLKLSGTCLPSLAMYPPRQINPPEAEWPFTNVLYNRFDFRFHYPVLLTLTELVLNSSFSVWMNIFKTIMSIPKLTENETEILCWIFTIEKIVCSHMIVLRTFFQKGVLLRPVKGVFIFKRDRPSIWICSNRMFSLVATALFLVANEYKRTCLFYWNKILLSKCRQRRKERKGVKGYETFEKKKNQIATPSCDLQVMLVGNCCATRHSGPLDLCCDH